MSIVSGVSPSHYEFRASALDNQALHSQTSDFLSYLTQKNPISADGLALQAAGSPKLALKASAKSGEPRATLADLAKPDAYILGGVLGVNLPFLKAGGAAVVLPVAKNTFSDPSLLFVQSIARTPIGGGSATLSLGPVQTYNPKTNIWDVGFGGIVRVVAGDNNGILIVNGRGKVPQKGDFTASVNVGAAIGLLKPGAVGLDVLSKGLAAVGGMAAEAPPVAGALEGAAAASSAGARGLDALRASKLGDGYAGVGWRLEARFHDGKLTGFYKGGKKVELETLIAGAQQAQERHKPPVIPDGGISGIAALNATSQEIFGSNPYDLARQSKGKNNGDGAIAVANSVYGVAHRFNLLGPGEGIRSNADADALVAKALDRASRNPKDYQSAVSSLSNAYDIDFGSPAVAQANALRNTLKPRPQDYQFVRNVLQGVYRDRTDQPLPDGIPAFDHHRF